MTTNLRRLLAICVLGVGLQACGLKGGLYLEEPGTEAPPSVELQNPESEAEAELHADPQAEEVGVGDGVPSAEPGPVSDELPLAEPADTAATPAEPAAQPIEESSSESP